MRLSYGSRGINIADDSSFLRSAAVARSSAKT